MGEGESTAEDVSCLEKGRKPSCRAALFVTPAAIIEERGCLLSEKEGARTVWVGLSHAHGYNIQLCVCDYNTNIASQSSATHFLVVSSKELAGIPLMNTDRLGERRAQNRTETRKRGLQPRGERSPEASA